MKEASHEKRRQVYLSIIILRIIFYEVLRNIIIYAHISLFWQFYSCKGLSCYKYVLLVSVAEQQNFGNRKQNFLTFCVQSIEPTFSFWFKLGLRQKYVFSTYSYVYVRKNCARHYFLRSFAIQKY